MQIDALPAIASTCCNNQHGIEAVINEMPQRTYDSIIEALAVVGLIGQQRSRDQLIVSKQQGPVWPNRGNSFWLSLQNGLWHLCTWSPVCYRIPQGQDLVALCSACMAFGTSAMHRVPDDIVARFNLTRISDDEFDRLFPEDAASE